MKRPVFSFRPNRKDRNHRKAWSILEKVPEGEKSQFVVDAILFYDQAVSRLHSCPDQISAGHS